MSKPVKKSNPVKKSKPVSFQMPHVSAPAKNARFCDVKICEDADTGEIFTVRGKNCPPGTYEQIAHAAMKYGLQFRFKREGEKEEKEEEEKEE